MNTYNDINLAKKYEWNAFLARNRQNESDAKRYETMSKIAMMNAAQSANINLQNNTSKYIPNTATRSAYSSSSTSVIWTIIGAIIAVGVIVFS